MKNSLIYIIFSLILFTGCATYQSNHQSTEQSNLENINNETLNIFLIGDAGKLESDGSTPKALISLQDQFSNADKKDILLFLGDNVYQKGIPESKKDQKYLVAKEILQKQIDIAKTFPGKVYFIPGNHDWYSGLEGLKNQEKIVEKALGKNSFLPESGCPIEKVNINEDVVLLIIDSQWYITNWNNHPTINDKCDIKTRGDFLDEIRSEIKKAEGKITLVAIHHPIYTYGEHAGFYNFNNYLKPTPILGSLKNIIRTTSGIVNADIYNEFYNDLRKNIIAVAQQNDKVIFLSGHDHSLQYIEKNNIKQIISGSGSKTTPVKVKSNNDYGEGANGFAVLNIHQNLATNVQFYNAQNKKISFNKNILNQKEEQNITYHSSLLNGNNKTKASIYTKEETNKTDFYKYLWGNRFRNYYSTDVNVKIAKLDTLKGGLTPLRKGGGTQSKTLHLEDKEGKRYVMRAMKKQATQFIQAAILKDQYIDNYFNDTASEEFLEDIFTGSHPYAPFVISKLSDAALISHLNPMLYYVPKQDILGKYNNVFGNELYLFEEHPSDGHLKLANNGFTGKIISTFDMIKEIQSDESKKVDEIEFIRARLFDMLIGDADRHQDQWRWLEFKEDNKTIYKPLPRDRDLAFSRMSDGFIPKIAVTLIPAARKFRKYEPDLKDVKGFNVSGFPLDVAFTSQSNKLIWDEQVAFIQNALTDEVIENAFNELPQEVNDSTITEIKEILKQRRNNLKIISDKYIKLVKKYSVLTATNKDDYIKIINKENGEVNVSILRNKKGIAKDQVINCTYNPKNTKEIWIYGLDDDDKFEVVGTSKKIKIRLIGGQNNDEYKIENGKNIIVYDYKSKPNTIIDATKAKIKLTDDYETNTYDYRKLRNNINQVLPSVGFNPDDGMKIGLVDTYTTYGFERNPYTQQHQLKAFYYFATKGYELDYNSEYANVIGNLNLNVEATFHSPNFSLNFFGYGNETTNVDDDKGLDYNRVKVREFSLKPSLVWNSKRGSKIKGGISYESIEIHNTENRFISDFNLLPNYVFEDVEFAGINANYSFLNANNKAYPTMGLQFNLDIGFKQNLNEKNKNYGYLIPSLGIVHSINGSEKLVLASNLKAHFNFGHGFEFYQAASIGGIEGLRGFRNQRFTGRNSFYQNTDLRYIFNSTKTQLIPIKMGVYGSFDYGRVWLNDEKSNKWHNTYGGGFFANAVELLSANIGIFNSSDGIRIAFGLGFGF